VNSDKLRRTEHAVEAYRAQIDTHKAEKYGFASMAAVPYAHIVAQLLGKKRPKGTEINLAPNPKDIVSKLFLLWCAMPTLVHTDLGKFEPVFSRDVPQEDDGLVPALHDRLPEHCPALRAFHSCQLILRVYNYFFLPDFSLSYTRRLPALSHSSNTGLSLPQFPSTLFPVYSPPPCLRCLVSSCLS
jgi:hypothetical protein